MYRDYKTVNFEFFKRDFAESLEIDTTYDYPCFQNIFITLLNKHAPIKRKIMRFNNNPFMSKSLRKAIMYRPKLKKIFIINIELKKNGQITESKETFALSFSQN